MNEQETDKVNTFIYGSCVSRDTFEYIPSHFHLLKYVARQSLISAGTDARVLAPQLKPIDSAFQQRMVNDDLAGTLPTALRGLAPQVDLLLIDLVDERGGVVDLDGSYATKLSEFWTAGGREAARGKRQLELGSDEHFRLWEVAAQGFVALLGELDLVDKTVVLRTPWADRYADGKPLEIPAWMLDPADADARYARYFDVLEQAGLRIVTLPQELARTPADHRWGASPFHYIESAYEFLSREIVSAAKDAPVRVGGPPARLTRRDTSEWGEFTEVRSAAQVIGLASVPDLLTVWDAGYPIDLMVEDNGARTTLVSFHAALGATGLKPPIFTGRAISQHLGVNRVFVSDPSLLAGDDLGLAWYLGTSALDLTSELVRIIGALQERFGAEHLVFFGMSGGGFAALNVAHEFPGSLAVPVNPQTRILDYAEAHWDAMARACLGAGSTQDSRDILESHPRADLRRVYSEGFDNSVIYVQNHTDGHVINQMVPWFEAIGWDHRALALMRDWGKGHVAPPAPELRSLLSSVAEVDGDWDRLAAAWGARPANRDWVRKVSGR